MYDNILLMFYLTISWKFLPMFISWTVQATLSFQNSKLIPGRASHGTRGFKKGSGISNIPLWTEDIWSQFSHINFDKVTFLISASWDSVNLVRGFPPSYQNLSHFLKLRNWIPIIQANVGPTKPPCKGVSAKPPVT